MPDNIDSISPDFRDYLLSRNLILSDTVTDNGLDGLASGLGYQGTIGSSNPAVQASEDIEEDGLFYKDLNINNNPYQDGDAQYKTQITTDTVVNIGNRPPGSTPAPYGPVIAENEEIHNVPLAKFENLTPVEYYGTKNLYNDEDLKERRNINKEPILTVAQRKSYLEEYGFLNNGTAVDVLELVGSAVRGQGVINGGGFDIRTSLAGRGLVSSGLLNDTSLGKIGGDQLALHFGYTAAFGLQQETIGNVNLNPLSLAGGNDFIVPNYSITVPSGTLGGAFDFISQVFGFESPVALFESSSSIFQDENPVGNVQRANAQIANTGKGQVLALFDNLLANKDDGLNRIRYRPGFKDERVSEGANQTNNIFPQIYAGGTEDGEVIDLLNPTVKGGPLDGQPTRMAATTMDPELLKKDFQEDYIDTVTFGEDGTINKDGFIWGDEKLNKPAQEAFDGPNYMDDFFTQRKSILYKTKELFKTNRMRTLVSGHGDGTAKRSQIQRGVRYDGAGSGFMSKGSGVLSSKVLNLKPGEEAPTNPKEVFCRTWTPLDRYNQVQDMIRHEGLNPDAGVRWTTEGSVLDDNGFVRIAPKIGDDLPAANGSTNIKMFMFSIENLAWSDKLQDLMPAETGPGDLLSGKKGRIMWFPPYEMSFTDNTSVNWEKSDFIGRGEPIYTYNNTERTGTLQWKIIIDHPTYLNGLKDKTNDEIASLFAGCSEIDPKLLSKLSQSEKDVIEVKLNKKKETKETPKQTPPPKFSVYYPNDSTDVFESSYENGKIGGNDGPVIPYDLFPDGSGYGEGQTQGGGFTNSEGTTFNDRNNFGLNANFFDTWTDVNDSSNVGDGFVKWATECDTCVAKIKGYASTQGRAESNKKLSTERAQALADWMKPKLTQALEEANKSTENVNQMIKVVEHDDFEIEVGDCIEGRGVGISQDKECLKRARKADVEFEPDSNLAKEVKKTEEVAEPETTETVSRQITSRFYNEATFFDKLKQDDKFVYDSIRDKIKFFQPAFHSITPEGFNSRLSFLMQCTRQGPTKSISEGGNPNNLSFGRPPICILRVGDFYHTKIVIDSVNLSFDPLVWDLNPEGVGVQPMVCTVDMQFAFIGGSSLQGPINKLQNAVTHNFFANTEIYDKRADRIEITEDGAKIVEGKGPDYTKPETESDANKEGIGGDEQEKDQVAQAEEEANQADEVENTDNEPKLTSIRFFENIATGVQGPTGKKQWDLSFYIAKTNLTTEENVKTLVDKGVKVKIVGGPIGDLFNQEFPITVNDIGTNSAKEFKFDIKNIILGDGNYGVKLKVGNNNIGNTKFTIP
jgi:hypothetical protein